MKRMKNIVVILMVIICNNLISQEILKNEDVVFMSQIKLDKAVILQKISSSKNLFDVSMAGLKGLSTAGVEAEVIVAMTKAASDPALAWSDPNDPMSPHPGGFYYYSEKMLKLLAYTNYSAAQAGGHLANSLTYGLAKIKTNILLSDSCSKQSFQRTPLFYFYSDVTGQSAFSGWGQISPNSFVCVKFISGEGKNSRSLEIGSANILGATSGIAPEQTVQFDFVELSSGIYMITFPNSIEKGSYAFMHSSGLQSGGEQYRKAFDFTIK
jgi:hypothetical protein